MKTVRIAGRLNSGWKLLSSAWTVGGWAKSDSIPVDAPYIALRKLIFDCQKYGLKRDGLRRYEFQWILRLIARKPFIHQVSGEVPERGLEPLHLSIPDPKSNDLPTLA